MVWGKPAAEGAAAVLTTAENENEQQEQQQEQQQEKSSEDFPSLMEATVGMKGGKKSKRNQTKMSLSEFTTGIASGPGAKRSSARVSAESQGLTPEEMMALPTGPRQRSEEELQQQRERGGFKSGGFFPRDSFNSGPRRRDSEDLYPPREPSRADAAERWGGGGGGGGGGLPRASEREAPRSGFGFGDASYSKADDVDNWFAAKKSAPPPAAAREKKFGFGFSDSASYSRADGTENWSVGKQRENGFGRREGGGFSSSSAFDSIRKDRDYGGERWGNGGVDGSATDRKRLVLQPRSVGVGVGETAPVPLPSVASSRNNPFGNARPREEVLKDKGQDWRVIDMEIHSRSGREAARGAADWQQQQRNSWPDGDWRKKENSREAKGFSDVDSESGSENSKTAVVAAACEEVDKLADNLNVKTDLGVAEGSQI